MSNDENLSSSQKDYREKRRPKLLNEDGKVQNPWVKKNRAKWNEYQAKVKREKYATLTPEERKEMSTKSYISTKKNSGLKEIEACISKINEKNSKSSCNVQFKLIKPRRGQGGEIKIEVDYKKGTIK